nr:hypothetical protein BaRGS_013649 [Batillaria attramentaria]
MWTNIYQGPGQLVNLSPGKLYNFTSYVKQLNDMPGKMFQKYRVNVGYTWRDDKFVTAKLHFQTPDISIEFLVDDTSLTPISDDPTWRQEADKRIQQVRMGDIHFNMLVRAHNMFWGFEKNLPPYVLHMSRDQLNVTVEDRLKYMVNITKGKADHWDIMNEMEHGQWFEEQFHDPNYSEHLYREVHQLDPKPLLMLNDYAVIGRPEITDAYLQQAKKFLADGVPLHGLGIQGHFQDSVPDPQLMKLQLDQMSEAGLPMWVTEMDVWQQDLSVRADYYETVLRAFFSHPSVDGIVFWGFWDHHVVNKLSSLVDGAHMQINEAGQRYLHLTKEEWSTHVNKSLSAGTSFDVRGFKGDYEVTVRKNGMLVKIAPFSLTGGSTTVNIDIDDTIGVYAYAACCTGANLSCVTVTSGPQHGNVAHAECGTGRNNNAGPFQTVQLKSGTRYRLQAYAKQLNDAANKMFQSYTIKVIYPASHEFLFSLYTADCRTNDADCLLDKYADDTALTGRMTGDDDTHYRHEIERFVECVVTFSSVGWGGNLCDTDRNKLEKIIKKAGGVVGRAIQSAQIHIQGPDGHIDFLLDDVSMTEISEDTHWQAAADTRIDTLRKGDIHVRVQLPSGMDPNSIEVQIDHKKHQFMFGSLGHPDFTQALAALHELKAHGLEVRGHNMFWGFEKNLPTWVPQLSHDQLNDTVEERLRYLVSITKGQ